MNVRLQQVQKDPHQRAFVWTVGIQNSDGS